MSEYLTILKDILMVFDDNFVTHFLFIILVFALFLMYFDFKAYQIQEDMYVLTDYEKEVQDLTRRIHTIQISNPKILYKEVYRLILKYILSYQLKLTSSKKNFYNYILLLMRGFTLVNKEYTVLGLYIEFKSEYSKVITDKNIWKQLDKLVRKYILSEINFTEMEGLKNGYDHRINGN